MREHYLVQNTITDASTPLNLNAELHLQNRKVQPYALKKARFPTWRNKSWLGSTAEDNDEEDVALRLKVSKRH